MSPPAPRSSAAGAAGARPRLLDRLDAFVSDRTGGVRPRDIARLFDRDAADAYSVLARDHALEAEPEEAFARFGHRLRILFLGFSAKLNPTRRLLFVASLVFALLGAIDFGFAFDFQGRLVFDSSPLWFLFSVSGLVFLLALELVDQVRVRDELEVARQLQQELLPESTPACPGWRISHAYRTAQEVGGDYYDFRRLEDGRLALVVGDASGHGIAAGLLMAIANSALNLAIDLDPEPRAVLEVLNKSLVRTGSRQAFMSMFYALLDLDSGRLDYAISGHPFPLVRRSRTGETEELGSGSLPLGIRRDLEIVCGACELHDGDLLVAFSDGLPEALDSDDQSFGYPRLHQLVVSASTPETAHRAILDALDQHLGDRPLSDDFSLVVLGRMMPPPLPGTATP